ncbi:hypothetical protein FOVSG1_015367 [Fusarium oxysporum f. sp. vasinfectum]
MTLLPALSRREYWSLFTKCRYTQFQLHIARSSTAVDDCAVWLFYALSVVSEPLCFYKRAIFLGYLVAVPDIHTFERRVVKIRLKQLS